MPIIQKNVKLFYNPLYLQIILVVEINNFYLSLTLNSKKFALRQIQLLLLLYWWLWNQYSKIHVVIYNFYFWIFLQYSLNENFNAVLYRIADQKHNRWFGIRGNQLTDFEDRRIFFRFRRCFTNSRSSISHLFYSFYFLFIL